MISYKLHYIREHDKYLLAMADARLVGKTINQYHIDPSFYDGKRVSLEDMIGFIESLVRDKKLYIINAIGRDSIDLLRKIFHDFKTLIINDEPHAQILLEE